MALDWPAGLERTPAREREKTTKFGVTLRQAIEDIEKEMDRLGVDQWRLSTALDHRRDQPNYPYSDQSKPDDTGVLLEWSKDGEQFAIGSDRYKSVRDNARALGLYVAEKRKMEQRPISTGQSEFATARLPAADEDAVIGEQPPHDVLGVAADAPANVVRAAARELIKEKHPDTGDGDQNAVKRIVRAREQLIEQ